MNYFALILFTLFFSVSVFSIEEKDSDYLVAPIPGNVNTENQEFGVSLSSNGKSLYFHSKRNSNYTDLFKSIWKDGKWQNPVELKVLNSPYDDQSPFVNSEEKFILFSSNRNGSVEFRLPSGELGVSRDLYYSENINGRWSKPYPLSDLINTDDMEENPFVYQNHLYFTRYPFGKLQEAKIYRSKIVGNEFMYPEELPSPINIPNSSNIAAVVSNTGEYLYFSSNRKGGYGGFDIYRSKIDKEGNFGEAENLGSKINTSGDEAYLVINQEDNSLLFCRKKIGESYDIYTARKEEVKIPEPEKIAEIKTPKKEPEPIKEIKPEPKKESEKTELDKITETLKEKKKLTLNNIYFDINSSELLLESLPALNLVTEFLQTNKAARIRVIGHTDLTGDLDYNKQLSQDRAESVKKFFVSKGIATNRISTLGKGSTEPIVPDTKPESNRKNRRTEFEVLD
ncbi:MAG: OmpA family protein [Leptospiraceae bacterium]|nr:OmpA family protein [Leptospiraceae bacterium]